MHKSLRRSFLKKAIAGLAAASILPPGALHAKDQGKKKAQNAPGDFMHVVFFWLKDPEDQSARDSFVRELKTLTKNIDVIITKHIGTPADTSRGVIDTSYTYSLILTFSNKEDQDIYQEHPVHLKFIENAGNLWEKVVVYDSLSI